MTDESIQVGEMPTKNSSKVVTMTIMTDTKNKTYEELVEREAKIAECVKDAAIFYNGDTVGMLYDKLSETIEDLRVARLQLRDMTETITGYKNNEPWMVAENR